MTDFFHTLCNSSFMLCNECTEKMFNKDKKQGWGKHDFSMQGKIKKSMQNLGYSVSKEETTQKI